MTAEQEKQVQTAKLNDQRAAYTGAVMSASMRDRRNLIAIIDDLKQPKRYTEAELYGIWRDAPESETGDNEESWDGALWFARFLGMIKTEDD